MLSYEEILQAVHSQVEPVHNLDEFGGKLVILNCTRVGTRPSVEWVQANFRLRFDVSEFGDLSSRIYKLLSLDTETRLLILCDLYAHGNDPRPGVTWDRRSRDMGAIMGTMSCLLVLIRSVQLREFLFECPEHLLIATVHEEDVSVKHGRGESMIAYVREDPQVSEYYRREQI